MISPFHKRRDGAASFGPTIRHRPPSFVSIVRAVGSAFFASICLSWSELHSLHLRAFRRLTSRGFLAVRMNGD